MIYFEKNVSELLTWISDQKKEFRSNNQHHWKEQEKIYRYMSFLFFWETPHTIMSELNRAYFTQKNAPRAPAGVCWPAYAEVRVQRTRWASRRKPAAAVRLCHLSPIPPAPQRFEERIARCVQFCSSAAGSRELRQPNRLLPTPPLRLDSTLGCRVTYVHVFERTAESRERREPTPAGPSPSDFSTLLQHGAPI